MENLTDQMARDLLYFQLCDEHSEDEANRMYLQQFGADLHLMQESGRGQLESMVERLQEMNLFAVLESQIENAKQEKEKLNEILKNLSSRLTVSETKINTNKSKFNDLLRQLQQLNQQLKNTSHPDQPFFDELSDRICEYISLHS